MIENTKWEEELGPYELLEWGIPGFQEGRGQETLQPWLNSPSFPQIACRWWVGQMGLAGSLAVLYIVISKD